MNESSKVCLVFFILALVVSPSLQAAFKLPYCSELKSDTEIVKNPLRIYLIIFRWLFCLNGDREKAITSSGIYLSASQASSKAQADYASKVAGTTTCTSASSTVVPEDLTLQVSSSGTVVRLSASSLSSNLLSAVSIEVVCVDLRKTCSTSAFHHLTQPQTSQQPTLSTMSIPGEPPSPSPQTPALRPLARCP